MHALSPSPRPKEAKLFRNNRSQAVRIPVEFELPGDRVLIAEACSHHALADDIGRVKIPRWLRQYAGGHLDVDVRSGKDFPEDLSPYALVVQCGGCTVTRKQILVRQYRAARQGVPMTNYGMAISVVQGVLDRSLHCFPAALEAYRRALEGVPA